MLKKLAIKNFKVIENMTVEFTPLTVLIGGNACGKSTVLQALDFLRSAATKDFSAYLEQRNWTWDDLKFQANGAEDKPVEFVSEWRFQTDDKTEDIKWHLRVDFNKTGWNIYESITKDTDNIVLYDNVKCEYYPPALKEYKVQSSILKILKLETERSFSHLQNFLSMSDNFELLSPDRIRSRGSRGHNDNIGTGGEMLAGYIYDLRPEQKQMLNTAVADFMGNESSIKTQKMLFSGWIELFLSEKFKQFSTNVRLPHISDGALRIIALSAITTQNKNSGFLLLDEIENGINPYLTEKVINLLHKTAIEACRQIIVTTHSPVILDCFNPEEIVFMWKNESGSACCKKMFSTKRMTGLLKALHPGEIWVNLDKENLLKRLNEK
jgi:predicted ATPase